MYVAAAPNQVVEVRTIADETARFCILLYPKHAWQPVLQSKFGQGRATRKGEWRWYGEKTVDAFSRHCRERPVEVLFRSSRRYDELDLQLLTSSLNRLQGR